MSARRENREEILEGEVKIDDKTYQLDNWSSMGFLAKNYSGNLKNEDRVDIAVSLKSLNQEDFNFTCQSIIVRADKESQLLAGAFVRIPPETRKRISDHFTKKPGIGAKIIKIKDFLLGRL